METKKMAKLSELCKIILPSNSSSNNPMPLFNEFLSDYKRFATPKVITMNLATVNKKYSILNRTVVYRGLIDDDNITFVTERNTQKYKDIQENPKIALTFLFLYKNDERKPIAHQIRVNGTAVELTENQIDKFWNEDPVYAKIRSIICECGKPVDWDQLKAKHDEILKAYEEGTEKLNRTETYTAFKIIPELIDFYYSSGNTIADRIRYTKDENNTWSHTHVCT